jgi:hypothetical protein
MNASGWDSFKLIGSRSVLEVVAVDGRIYLFERPRPGEYERVDHGGLHEAGYGPDDFE